MNDPHYEELPCWHRDPSDREPITQFLACRRFQIWPSPTYCQGCSARDPVAGDWPGDWIELWLLRRFARRPRIVVEDAGAVSACDDKTFAGFQFLYYSVALSHVIPMTVFDLGMAPERRRWCERQAGLVVRECPEPLLMPRSEPDWKLWNKPIFLRDSPYRRTLWLDADTMVLGDLRELLAHLDRAPVAVRQVATDPSWDRSLTNPAALYDLFPVPEPKLRALPNAGVLGFVAGRDADLLDAWSFLVQVAAASPTVRGVVRFHDQGALHWALEKTGRTRVVLQDRAWNALRPSPPAATPVDVMDGMVPGGGKVLHYLGPIKPWSYWTDPLPIDLEGRLARRLRFYVLGYQGERLARVPRRGYFEPVRLDLLDLGPCQRNELSEFRIYLADADAVATDREYVGLGSARWNEKYSPPEFRDKLHLDDFDFLEPYLEPDIVLAAEPTGTDWADQSEPPHPGILPLLHEMADISGLDLHAGPSLAANNFICHHSVFHDLRRFSVQIFEYFHAKYGWDLPFSVGRFDHSRRASYFYERVSMLYFANRRDLTIRELSHAMLGNRGAPATAQVAPPSLTVLIATVGRPTLARTLRSIGEQVLRPGDEVLVVGDGPQPRAREIWESAGLPGRYLEYPDGPSGDWGHTPRNWAMPLARGDYLLHMDDDDIYLPRAFEIIRAALVRRPGRPHLFRMQVSPTLHIWDRPDLVMSNVSTQLFVHPARPGTYGRWVSRRGGDYDFIKETAALWPPGSLVWREECIARMRPD